MPLKITSTYSSLVRTINAEGITFAILTQVKLEFHSCHLYPVATRALALTPKSADVTLRLSSEATQSSLLESRLGCEKGWHSLSPDDRGCLYAG